MIDDLKDLKDAFLPEPEEESQDPNVLALREQERQAREARIEAERQAKIERMQKLKDGNKQDKAEKRATEKLMLIGAGAAVSRKIEVVIYARVAGVRTEIHRAKKKVTDIKFAFKGKEYIIDTNSNEAIELRKLRGMEKASGDKYIAGLEYDEGNPFPLKKNASTLKMDAEALQRVTSKASRDSLLPSSDSMLVLLAMLCVVGMLVSLGVAGYAIAVPGGADNLRNAFNPGPQRDDNDPQPSGRNEDDSP